jgi:hypothetical protein
MAHLARRRRAMTLCADWALSLPERKAAAAFLAAAFAQQAFEHFLFIRRQVFGVRQHTI